MYYTLLYVILCKAHGQLWHMAGIVIQHAYHDWCAAVACCGAIASPATIHVNAPVLVGHVAAAAAATDEGVIL